MWGVPRRPWASFPRQVVSVPDAAAARGAVLDAGASALDTAFVESPVALPAAEGRVISIDRGAERVTIVAEAGSDATLVVNDAYWPGWFAAMDGDATEIYPSDGVVRAVRWPRGRHTLVMEYRPPEVTAGKWLTFAGVVALAGAWLGLRRWRRVQPLC